MQILSCVQQSKITTSLKNTLKPFSNTNICYQMGHLHNLLCEEIIFPLHKRKNNGLRYKVFIFARGQWKYHFFTQRLRKCHSKFFNDQNIHLFLEGFAFISCKYLHFICFVENLRTK